MRRISCTLVIAFLSSVAVASGAGLPPEVVDQLEKVIAFETGDGFVGSYHLTISTTIQKPNGRSREEELIEAEIVLDENGTEKRRLIKYLENGKDVTKRRRKKFEGKGWDDDGEGDEDFADPFGPAADRYSFGPVQTRGSTRVVSFEPAPGHEEDEDLSQGSIAWDAETFEPLWMEMEATQPPKPLKKLYLRTEFQRIGETLYLTHMETDGLASLLLLKREFHMELTFDDIRPATQSAD
jgi:hypothetical protein